MIEQKELDEMLEAEQPFSHEELSLMKRLITDRVEDRFRFAQKMASQMDLQGLSDVTDELIRLDELSLKLKEMEQ
jgi:hypothetical protein